MDADNNHVECQRIQRRDQARINNLRRIRAYWHRFVDERLPGERQVKHVETILLEEQQADSVLDKERESRKRIEDSKWELIQHEANQQNGVTTPSDSGIDDESDSHSNDASGTDSDAAGNESGASGTDGDAAGNESGVRINNAHRDQEITRLQGELAKAQKNYAEASAPLRHNYNSPAITILKRRNENLKYQMEIQQQAIQEKDEENERLRDSRDSKEQELIAMRKTLEESTRLNAEQQGNLKDGQIKMQKEEAETAREESGSRRVSENGLRVQFANLKTVLEEKNIEIAHLTADKESLTTDLSSARRAITAADAQRDVAYKERDSAQTNLQDMKTVHEAQHRRAETEREQLVANLEGVQAQLREEQELLAVNSLEAASLKQQLETTRTALIAAEVQRDVAHEQPYSVDFEEMRTVYAAQNRRTESQREQLGIDLEGTRL